MDKYGHKAFIELMKDKNNNFCFDCGRQPAEWASINNGIYLCISCSGNHRGYGVDVSYIRSITLDSWNDSQIALMKNGGNKNCVDLLLLYGINKDLIKNKQNLYESKIMNFYRKFLKNKATGIIDNSLNPPSKESALSLINLEINYNNNSNTNNNLSKFSSVDSSVNEQNDNYSFSEQMSNWMNKAYNGGKYITQKVGELQIGNKIASVGNTIMEKTTNAAQSTTVQNFAKKANQSINFLMAKLFGNSNDNNLDNKSNIDNNKANGIINNNGNDNNVNKTDFINKSDNFS